MARARVLALGTALLLLEALPLAAAHGHGEGHHDAPVDTPPQAQNTGAPASYWSLSEHASLMYWHIGLEILAWVFVLPVGRSTLAPTTIRILC